MEALIVHRSATHIHVMEKDVLILTKINSVKVTVTKNFVTDESEKFEFYQLHIMMHTTYLYQKESNTS